MVEPRLILMHRDTHIGSLNPLYLGRFKRATSGDFSEVLLQRLHPASTELELCEDWGF